LNAFLKTHNKMTRQTSKHSALRGDLIYDETSSSLFIETLFYSPTPPTNMTNMTIL